MTKTTKTKTATKKAAPKNGAAKKFATIPVGTAVTWHYRSAIGHGKIAGIHKLGTSSANTEYSIRQSDHHKGESAIVYHFGRALKRG